MRAEWEIGAGTCVGRGRNTGKVFGVPVKKNACCLEEKMVKIGEPRELGMLSHPQSIAQGV